jgi:hypothetical protein
MGRFRDPHIYDQDETYPTYDKARERKDQLKSEGFRVKIRKSEVGHVVYKKDITFIGSQRNRRTRKLNDNREVTA